MILYVSNATSWTVFNDLFQSGAIRSGHQMQKFNNNLMNGLSECSTVVSVSVLPYAGCKAGRIEREEGRIKYICMPNSLGRLRKVSNLINTALELSVQIRKCRPEAIVVDAIAQSPLYASLIVGKLFRIPVVGVVTDLPNMIAVEKMAIDDGRHLKMIRKCSAFVLLTKQMNDVVNPDGKPYCIIEGIAPRDIPSPPSTGNNGCDIVMYAGALWRELAGIEQLVLGFLQANIPNTELHIYGSGELEPWLEEVSARNHSVQYLGNVLNSEVVSKQREASLLVNPRLSNELFCQYSFPSKTIEYMLSGVPVLMTRLPGVPSEYFDYVSVIEDESPEGIKRALIRFFEKDEIERVAQGLRARKYIVENKGSVDQARVLYRMILEMSGR